MAEKYRTIQLPKKLADLIQEFIEKEYRFPYRSVSEFVIESARIRFFELKKEIEERKKEEERHGGGKGESRGDEEKSR